MSAPHTSTTNKRRRLDDTSTTIHHPPWAPPNTTASSTNHDDLLISPPTTTLFSPNFPLETTPLTPASSTHDSSNNTNHLHPHRTFSPDQMPPPPHDPLAAAYNATSWPPSPDDYATNPAYLASQEELRSLLFNTAQSTRAPSPAANVIIDDGEGGAAAEEEGGQTQQQEMKRILGSRKRVSYLRNYITKVAPWLDMFDATRHFGIHVPTLAQTQPPLLYAILALSARHMERQQRQHHRHPSSSGFDSIELYQEAIRLLTPKLPERSPYILTCCVILCCLEMMSASPQDWRRHLEGCATLFDSFDVNGFSGGLLQNVFWCYVRMDLCGALISDGTESTLLALRKWVPTDVTTDDAVHDLFHAHRTPDMHANYAVYLCSRACELLSDRTKYAELGVDNGCTGAVYAARWQALWHHLSLWHAERPTALHAVKTLTRKRDDDDRPFPEMLFVHWAAISSNQLYHTACILLLNSAPHGLALAALPVHNPLWHARRVCGISLSNPHEGCLNNACQPLWIAGRMLGHHSEHAAVIELIRNIEAQTGWGMYWRIRDLEEAWGYRSR